MKTRSIALVLVAAVALTGCQSRLNPVHWFGGTRSAGPATLEPEGGYVVASDPRQGFPRLTGARWEGVPGGRMLVVTGLAPTKGWWDVAILTEQPMPEGRIQADADGVLRLRMVGRPPLPDQAAGRMAANPQVDTITAAFMLTNQQLTRLRAVAVSGAGNSFTLNR